MTGTESQVTKRKYEERKEGGRGLIGCGVGDVCHTFGPCSVSSKQLAVPAAASSFLLGDRRLVSAGKCRKGLHSLLGREKADPVLLQQHKFWSESRVLQTVQESIWIGQALDTGQAQAEHCAVSHKHRLTLSGKGSGNS